MCGILGRINRKEAIDKDLFNKQLLSLNKRGPDAFGTYFNNNFALGQRRLSILDLSANGKQPMFNEDKSLAIVFNGEIYNYKELQKRLKEDHTISSNTDTEILLHAYEEFGEGIVDLIEGMFAFCILDLRKSTLFLVRDHFGKKPLYYYLDSDYFVFASEIKAILLDPVIKSKLSLDITAIEKYLYYGYIPSPNSVFSQIKKLSAASYVDFDINSFKLGSPVTFWYPENIVNNNLDEKQIIDETERLLDLSIEKRLMSDVPLGIFLSGGLDSSLVATYLSKKTNNLNSYTVSYPDMPLVDESLYAETVAKQCGFKYNLVPFSSSDVLSNFTEIFDYIDEPLADAAAVPPYFISKQARKNITVVLSGDGGDELYAGYHKYRAQQFIENNKYLTPLAKIAANTKLLPTAINKMVELFSEPFYARQFMFGSGSLLKDEVRNLLGNAASLNDIFSEAIHYDSIFKSSDVINRSTYLDWKLQPPDWYLVKSDRAAMANSQEMRSPFLDKSLAEFALSIPGSLKMKGGESKYFLKKIAARTFPHDFVYRPKRGFGVPLDSWIRNELKELFEQYLFCNSKLFNQDYVRTLFNEHLSGRKDNQFKLLRIFGVNYFISKYFS